MREHIEIFKGRKFDYLETESIKNGLVVLAEDYAQYIENLNIILVDDKALKRINQDYLDHDYYTDVITFDLSEEDDVLDGEIYISEDRIIDNASDHEIKPLDELRRVIIHGVLHLLGFEDKKEEDIKEMRLLEDKYLKRLFHVEQEG